MILLAWLFRQPQMHSLILVLPVNRMPNLMRRMKEEGEQNFEETSPEKEDA